MKALLKKEFMLCSHPTEYIFLLFCSFVFIPNYPYEVMFFFSGLSAFFVCLTARENGDAAFTCSLPVKKSGVAAARIVMCVTFQLALFVLAAVAVTVKRYAFPLSMQVNMSGSAANLAFLGNCLIVAAVFNIVFYPLYFKNPARVGVPFLLAGAAQFFLIAVMTVLRFAVPVFTNEIYAAGGNVKLQAIVFGLGVILYAGLTAAAIKISCKRFSEADI